MLGAPQIPRLSRVSSRAQPGVFLSLLLRRIGNWNELGVDLASPSNLHGLGNGCLRA